MGKAGWVGVVGVALMAACGAASGQIRADEVLVIYDSRLPDSREVAEYYAGSGAVPGGAGNLHGARAGVRVFDLASAGQPEVAPGSISYPNFVARLRDPIRNYLLTTGQSQSIRVLVTTKGLPHRVQDTDLPNAGDAPNQLIDEYNAGDATMASVDTELALLWQPLESGEMGRAADSLSDGVIVNPYWRATTPIRTQPTTNNRATKSYSAVGVAPTWTPLGSQGAAGRLSPGDLYLVSRLDAPTVSDVRGIIDRGGNAFYNTSTMAALLDESDSNGTTDAGANAEIDNNADGFPSLRDADDYEITRDELLADRRFAGAFTQYNALGGGNQFFVGPRLTWQAPVLLVNQPVVLLATYGANHTGRPRITSGTLADTIYATSFNYPNGAIFNTIESYNGRDFGGLGQPSGPAQQQASSFLAAGGTLAVCNVWEPLADTVPDNRFLSRNFIRGNLSWAEAAWSSIPALSWQQMVVGDPLARATRSSEDINQDGRVGVDDLYRWEATPTDVNGDGSLNATDRQFVVDALRSWERAKITLGRR